MNITPAPLLEIRVHGIGDKDALASLGSPTVVDTVDGRAELVTAPPLPGHRVLLVNWARWNRSGSAFGWIASWPFSLLNAAGEMRPPGRAGGRHRLLTNALALTATALAHVWLAAALEVVSLLIPASDDLRRWPSAVAVALAGVVLLAVLGQRAMSAQPPPRFVTATHALVVVGVASTLVLLRPSQLRADIGSVLFRGFAVDSYSTADFDRIGEVYAAGPGVEPVLTTAYLDPLAWVGYLTLTFAGVLLLMGLVLHRTPSTQCALLLGGIAVTLVNLYGAVLVALTQSAVTALQGVSVVQRLSTTQPRLDDVILIGRTGQGLSSRMLPLVTVLTLIATLLISALVGGRSPLGALRAGDRRAALNRWAHTTLPTIGARLTNIL
ncbi:hypothetical protein KMZ32_16350 [Phycicoccus sp. MAQZ13P-2]|uniref:hypothetical protein n=1 Tax=Phycicoccus mangrovi TaxID=2840470 RepID=UPI001C003FF1|nr:hypothetical protein [Phycicoccus mangrovi]MBT9257475.1 hypothetical protein [Phycicoccus mangrovi]MBT9275651.1 hypothetical protein [Phycicoccus mangrovi]